jgi:hypothetical protein
MTQAESPSDPPRADAEQYCRGTLSAEQMAALEQRLRDDPQAMEFFVLYMEIHSQIAWEARARGEVGSRQSAVGSGESEVGSWQSAVGSKSEIGDFGFGISHPSSLIPHQSSIINHQSSIILPPLPSPFSSLPASAGGILVSYLSAAVILSLGLLIAWAWKLPSYAEIARRSPPPAAGRRLEPEPMMECVGRITGMVDCQWGEGSEVRGQRSEVRGQRSGVRGQGSGAEDAKSRISDFKSYVSLGDKLVLRSGLMEITYDTGAKVVLQGPVTYEVDARNGGFLSVGKLTARLEKGEGGRGKAEGVAGGQWPVASGNQQPSIINQQSSNPQSPIPNPSSPFPLPPSAFVVRTPTATVTDLGTEFGVEVAKDGTCEVHVLKGLVQAQFLGAGQRRTQTVQLVEGEGRRYRYDAGQVTAIAVDRARFERMRIVKPDERRQRWLAYSRELRKDPALVAYYVFEAVANGDTRTLPNVSAAGRALDGRVESAEWVHGRLPGKYALYFHGPGTNDQVVLPEQSRFRFSGPFSVAVWFRIERLTGRYVTLIAKGDTSWRIQQCEDKRAFVFETDLGTSQGGFARQGQTPSRTEVADGRWHLAVAVYWPSGNVAQRRLYVDGQLDAEDEARLPLHQNDEPVWLGANSMSPHGEFQGWIDEVAIFSRALSAGQVAAMFEAGSPTGKVPSRPHKNQ